SGSKVLKKNLEPGLNDNSFLKEARESFLKAKRKKHRIYEVGAFQTGVCRCNCIDSLDRTNVAQFIIGKVALGYQLCAMGLLDTPWLDRQSDMIRVLLQMYERMGDCLALQYGGSQMHRQMKEDHAEARSMAPVLYQQRGDGRSRPKEMLISFLRHYENNFKDNVKQDAINLFLDICPLLPVCNDRETHLASAQVRTIVGASCDGDCDVSVQPRADITPSCDSRVCSDELRRRTEIAVQHPGKDMLYPSEGHFLKHSLLYNNDSNTRALPLDNARSEKTHIARLAPLLEKEKEPHASVSRQERSRRGLHNAKGNFGDSKLGRIKSIDSEHADTLATATTRSASDLLLIDRDFDEKGAEKWSSDTIGLHAMPSTGLREYTASVSSSRSLIRSKSPTPMRGINRMASLPIPSSSSSSSFFSEKLANKEPQISQASTSKLDAVYASIQASYAKSGSLAFPKLSQQTVDTLSDTAMNSDINQANYEELPSELLDAIIHQEMEALPPPALKKRVSQDSSVGASPSMRRIDLKSSSEERGRGKERRHSLRNIDASAILTGTELEIEETDELQFPGMFQFNSSRELTPDITPVMDSRNLSMPMDQVRTNID
ncbi:hypothetical protein RFI_16030, partial [Reticulomyxa filosa]